MYLSFLVHRYFMYLALPSTHGMCKQGLFNKHCQVLNPMQNYDFQTLFGGVSVSASLHCMHSLTNSKHNPSRRGCSHITPFLRIFPRVQRPDSTGCLMSMCDVSHSSHLTGVNFSKHLSLKDFMFPMTRPLGSAHAYSWEKHNLMTSSNSIATGQIINENYALYIIQFKFLHERCTIEF